MANCSCLQRKVDVSEKTRCYQNIRVLQEFVGIKQMKAEFFKTSDKKAADFALCLKISSVGPKAWKNMKTSNQDYLFIVWSPLEVRTKKPACRKSRWLHPLTQKFVFDLIDNGSNYY